MPYLEGLIELSNRVQRFFREWARSRAPRPRRQFVDLYAPLNFMVTLHTAMMGTAPKFAERFDANARLLRQLAGQLIETVLAEKSAGLRRRRRHAAGAGVAARLHCFGSSGRSTASEQTTNPISSEWILTDSPN